MATKKRPARAKRAPNKLLTGRRGRGFRGDQLHDEKRKHWEPSEVRAFFDAVRGDAYWEAYFLVQYTWGCRVSEPALVLKDEDLDLEGQKLVITRLKKNAADPTTPNGVEAYRYSIPDRVLPVLEALLEAREEMGREDSAWLFPSPTRRAWNPMPKTRVAKLRRDELNPYDSAISRMSAHRKFHHYADAAGIPDTKRLRRTHVLRHTRATLLFAEGADLRAVKNRLGHSSAATTEQYIHDAEALMQRYEDEGLSTMGLDDVFGD